MTRSLPASDAALSTAASAPDRSRNAEPGPRCALKRRSFTAASASVSAGAGVDRPLKLAYLQEKFVDLIAGLRAGQGGVELPADALQAVQFEQTGFELAFEGGKIG